MRRVTISHKQEKRENSRSPKDTKGLEERFSKSDGNFTKKEKNIISLEVLKHHIKIRMLHCHHTTSVSLVHAHPGTLMSFSPFLYSVHITYHFKKIYKGNL